MSDAAIVRAPFASASVALVPMRLGGFSCKAIVLHDEDRLTARFEAEGSADWVEVSVVPLGERGPVFRKLEHCAVKYRGAIAARTPERREEVSQLVMTIALSIDALLARSPGQSIAAALGRRQSKNKKLVFGRDALRDMLSPEVVEGQPIAEGFFLADVYPSSYLHKSHDARLSLVLDFRRESDGRRLLMVVGKRDDTRPAFATTAHFSITHLSLGAADPPGADALRALVAFVLSLRDHEGLELVFPDVIADVAPLLLAAPEAPAEETDEVLNLAIDADCGQSCVFCSIKDTTPAEDGGDRVLARVFADLASNRQRGVRRVRINGYDPLAYSRILEVLARAKALGYIEAHVFSPCTRLADEAFCDEVIAALPDDARFYVPLYSTRPEVHDAIVGRAGAHARVLRALDNLAARRGAGSIWILSVATKDGLDDLDGLARFAASRGIPFHPHMPYPSFESRADRYFSSAPRMSDVAEVIARAAGRGERLLVQGVVPCVVFRRLQKPGVHLRVWLDAPERKPPLPGTEYRDEKFRHRAVEAEHAAYSATSIPCPHEARCALASACPGEVLRSYAELYGTEELCAVTLRDIVDAT